MKKVLLSAFIGAMMVHSAAFAQQTFSIGPRFGVNFSDARTSATTNHEFKPGLAAGLYFIYSVSNNFGINVEAMYSEKGHKYNDASVANGKSIQNHPYIEVPVLGRYFFLKGAKVRPSLLFGPSFAYNLGSTRQLVEPTKGDKVSVAGFSDTDISLQGGLGVSFDLGGQWLNVDGRYIYGLTDINGGDLMNNTVQFTVGYAFGLGGK